MEVGNIDNIEKLIVFGLTRQEATIYMLLLAEGKLNGYEVAKKSGISRSNAYNALAGLVDKGAAYVVKENSIMYTPLTIEEFCENKIRLIKKYKEDLIRDIPKVKEEQEAYITIKGEDHIIDKMKNMVSETKERIYIAMDAELLKFIEEELLEIKDRKVKISIITDKSLKEMNFVSKDIFKGANLYYKDKNPNQIRIIVDSKKVLTGDIKDKENCTCLYSKNNNLVDVFKEALANEIKLINIGEGCV